MVISSKNPQYVIDSYTENWNLLQSDFPNYFYIVRDRFNLDKRPTDLLFLARTAVNGIIRFNSKVILIIQFISQEEA